MALRVTRQYTDTLGSGDGVLRTTRQYVDILGGSDGVIRVTRQYIDVLGWAPIIYLESCDTATTFNAISVFAYYPDNSQVSTSNTIILGQTASAHIATIRKTVTTPVSITQLAVGHNATLRKNVTTATPFAQTLEYFGTIRVDAYNNIFNFDGDCWTPRNWIIEEDIFQPITFAETTATFGAIYVNATNAIALQQYADDLIKARSASSDISGLANTVTYTKSSRVYSALVLNHIAIASLAYRPVSSTLTYSQTTHHSLIKKSASTALPLSQTVHVYGTISVEASSALSLNQTIGALRPWNITATSSLGEYIRVWNPVTYVFDDIWVGLAQTTNCLFTQTHPLHHYLQTNHWIAGVRIRNGAGAYSKTATTAVALTQHTSADQWVTASSTVSFTQTTTAFVGPAPTQVISLTQTASANIIRNSLTALSQLDLHGDIGYLTAEDVRCTYHPFIGGNAIPGQPKPLSPTLSTFTTVNGIQFYWPYEAAIPTYSWAINHKPNFGNKINVQIQRINRETRGGNLKIYRASYWPKDTTLTITMSNLTEIETTAYLTFLQNTLGKEIGYKDWLSRVYRGVILNIQDPIVRNGRGDNSVTIKFEITTRAFTNTLTAVTSPLAVTQTLDRWAGISQSPETALVLTSVAIREHVTPRSLFNFVQPQHNTQGVI